MGDFIVLYGALLAALFMRYYGYEGLAPIKAHYVPFAIIFSVWLIVFGSFGLYDLKFMRNGKLFLYRLLRAVSINFILAILFFYLLPFFQIEPRRNLFLITILGTIFLLSWRSLFNLAVVRTPSSRVLFIGITKEAFDLARFLLAHPQLGYQPAAFGIPDEINTSSLPFPHAKNGSAIPHINISKNLPHILTEQKIETIVITRDIKENRIFVKMLFEAIPLGVSVVEFTTFHEMLTGKVPMSLIEEIWFIENLIGSRRRIYEFFKRGLDIFLATAVGIPATILTLFIIAAIKLDSKGSAFFIQRRIGKDGKTFLLMKFRSMVAYAESMGGYKGEGRDPRHTRVGAFLRATYLDELPQIINILKGEMSFIGPRPERPQYVEELKKNIAFYEMRLLVPPGITGWAQINMENDASVEDAPEKMQYDLYYIKNRSFTLDLLIAIKTAFTLLQRHGR